MAQKANPISLRLQINRDFDTLCYAEKLDAPKLLSKELTVRKYIQKLSRHLDLSNARTVFQFYPKKLIVHSYFLDMKSRKGKMPVHLNDSSILSVLKYALQGQSPNQLSLFAYLFKKLSDSRLHFSGIQPTIQIESKPEILQILPVKLSQKYASAQFVADFIAKSLERNMSFRDIVRAIEREKPKTIVGLRISCSGRLAGAEMAKVESRKFGQTSLQTFSEKVDYATSEAYTLYGIIGVKVWLVSKN